MILTVIKSRQQRDWFDIDVPDDYPVIQLKEMLGMRVYGESPQAGQQYILEGKFPDGLWFTIRDSQDIAEAGLREGSLIRLQRAFSTTDEEAPVYGKRSLFQNDSIGVMGD
ncbi:hypothetical protein J23TS9_23880 [Paenibacillus sp. J23TS9]|uniref:hypothetical protein n=1 Tax=Paenibacillus sp. J23TS9 TaxID=2807193 RepID=UPI001B17BE9C|nr:hypothetical protein [Paenibacillus sp. J23TS9]GIP27258.1 hypothetical protein J23TS9_23880 [Paenibacillus sp. J23TS9]